MQMTSVISVLWSYTLWVTLRTNEFQSVCVDSKRETYLPSQTWRMISSAPFHSSGGGFLGGKGSWENTVFLSMPFNGLLMLETEDCSFSKLCAEDRRSQVK